MQSFNKLKTWPPRGKKCSYKTSSCCHDLSFSHLYFSINLSASYWPGGCRAFFGARILWFLSESGAKSDLRDLLSLRCENACTAPRLLSEAAAANIGCFHCVDVKCAITLSGPSHYTCCSISYAPESIRRRRRPSVARLREPACEIKSQGKVKKIIGSNSNLQY